MLRARTTQPPTKLKGPHEAVECQNCGQLLYFENTRWVNRAHTRSTASGARAGFWAHAPFRIRFLDRNHYDIRAGSVASASL
jgi:hypothetical protein